MEIRNSEGKELEVVEFTEISMQRVEFNDDGPWVFCRLMHPEKDTPSWYQGSHDGLDRVADDSVDVLEAAFQKKVGGAQ